MTDITKTYQSLEERFPMEEMRRLYLAKFGETVDGRLRLYGDWEISNRGALTTAEGEVLPFITLRCWFTFAEGTGPFNIYGVSCSVNLTTYEGQNVDGSKRLNFRPLSPFTAESTSYSMDYAYSHSRNPATIYDFTKRPVG